MADEDLRALERAALHGGPVERLRHARALARAGRGEAALAMLRSLLLEGSVRREAAFLLVEIDRHVARRLLGEAARETPDRAPILALLEELFPLIHGFAEKLRKLTDATLGEAEKLAVVRSSEQFHDPRFLEPLLCLAESGTEWSAIAVALRAARTLLAVGDLPRIAALESREHSNLDPETRTAIEKLRGQAARAPDESEHVASDAPSSIESIACSLESEGSLFATGSENTVALWSIVEKRRLAVFVSSAPHPSIALAGDGLTVVTGSLLRGVQAFDARVGAPSWRRDDLAGVRSVQGLPRGPDGLPRVGVAMGSGVYYVLDAGSGRELKRFRDVRTLFGGPSSKRAVAVGDTGFRVLDLASFRTVWRGDRVPTHATVAGDRVATVVGGALRCFDRRGELVFAWRPQESSALRVAWCEPASAWAVLVANRWTALRLVLLGTDGALARDEVLARDEPLHLGADSFAIEIEARGLASELTGDGSHVVLADGTVRSVPSGEVAWTFARIGGATAEEEDAEEDAS